MFLSCALCGDSFKFLLFRFGLAASAFEVLLEPQLGQLCVVALPHVAVKIPGVPAFQLFVDSRHMHAERVGYILRAFSFEIAGLQRLAVCQRQISVVSHVLTSLWCGCILRPFCKICIFGRVLLNRPPALRLASFFRAALTVPAFTLKAGNLLNDMGPF